MYFWGICLTPCVKKKEKLSERLLTMERKT